MSYMPGFIHEQLVSVVEFIYMGRTKMTSPLLQVSMATFHKLQAGRKHSIQ